MAVQPRWVWGRRKEVLFSSRKAGCVQEAVQGGEELMKDHSLCTSLRKKDPGATALLLGARWASLGKWGWLR